MMIQALGLEDILKIMAKDIDNDDAYIRIDAYIKNDEKESLDSAVMNTPKYLGPFSLYEPY